MCGAGQFPTCIWSRIVGTHSCRRGRRVNRGGEAHSHLREPRSPETWLPPREPPGHQDYAAPSPTRKGEVARDWGQGAPFGRSSTVIHFEIAIFLWCSGANEFSLVSQGLGAGMRGRGGLWPHLQGIERQGLLSVAVQAGVLVETVLGQARGMGVVREPGDTHPPTPPRSRPTQRSLREISTLRTGRPSLCPRPIPG